MEKIEPILKLNNEDIKQLKEKRLDISPDLKRDDDLLAYEKTHKKLKGNIYETNDIIKNSLIKIENYYKIKDGEMKFSKMFYYIFEDVFGKKCTKNNQKLIFNLKSKSNLKSRKRNRIWKRKIGDYLDLLEESYLNSPYKFLEPDYEKGIKAYEKSCNWEMTRRPFGKIKNLGEYSIYGDNIITGIEKSKTKNKRNDKILSIPVMNFDTDTKNPKHFMNMENIYAGYCSNDQVSDLVNLFMEFLNKYFLNQSIDIENWNEKINDLIKKYKEYDKIVNLLKSSYLKESTITKKDVSILMKNLYEPNIIRSGLIKCLVLDVDYDYTVYGSCMLTCLELLLSNIIHLTVRNKVPQYRRKCNCSKLNHCTIYIPFKEYHKLEEIKFLDDFFKFIEINDINHTYYIGKNPGNLELFDVYLSSKYSPKTQTRPRYIDDILNEENDFTNLIKEVIINYLILFNRDEEIEEILNSGEIDAKKYIESLYRSNSKEVKTIRKYIGKKGDTIKLLSFDNTKTFSKLIKSTKYCSYWKKSIIKNNERIANIADITDTTDTADIKINNWNFKSYLGRYKLKLNAMEKEAKLIKKYHHYNNDTLFKKDIRQVCRARRDLWIKIYYKYLPNHDIPKIKKELLKDLYSVDLYFGNKHVVNVTRVIKYDKDLINKKQVEDLIKRSEKFIDNLITNYLLF